MANVYLDHAACELPKYEVIEYMKDCIELSYNPSAIYQTGIRNRQIIESVREKIARMINCEPNEIYFTSGASESNSWAIDGYKKAHPDCYVLSTTIEHASINDNPEITKVISVDNNGFVDMENLGYVYDTFHEPETLYVIQHVNNEIGTVQNIREIRKIIKDGILFVDAAQSFGKLPINVKTMKIDMLSASARKIGGPEGVGFLYIRNGIRVAPIHHGSQEEGMRGGTYNELGIGAFGVALDLIDTREQSVIKSRRNFLIKELLKIKEIELIGTRSERAPGIVLIKIKNIDLGSQELVGMLDTSGFMVSSGSACHAGTGVFSHVLEAIGETPESAGTVIRISLGLDNSVDQLQDFIKVLRGIISMYHSH